MTCIRCDTGVRFARQLCRTCYWHIRGTGQLDNYPKCERRGKPSRAPEIIEDVEWIIGTDSPERIAARVGVPSLAALEQALRRAGRADLWNRLNTGTAAIVHTHKKAA